MDTVEDTMEAQKEAIQEPLATVTDSASFQLKQLFGRIVKAVGLGPVPTKVNTVQWSDYTNRSVTFVLVEGMFIVVPLPDDDLDDDPRLAYELIIHTDINNCKSAYSLLRTCTKEEAVKAHQLYDLFLPPLVASCGKEVLNNSTLQKVSDFIRDHSTYNVAHLVAHFGFVEALKNEIVLRNLNVAEEEDGFYPLHIAVDNELDKIVSALVASGSQVDVVDHAWNSPLHLAATKSPQIILALRVKGHKCLNLKNKNGETPLNMASQRSKLDNIRTLVSLGANVNYNEELANLEDLLYLDKIKQLEATKDFSQKDLHRGGSFLHWAKTRELVNLCLEIGCSPDLPNFFGETPAHITVCRNRPRCLMTLLSRGANPNIADQDGNFCIHVAAKQCSVSMVQALIVFGADIAVLNSKGESARHLAASCRFDDRTKGADRDRVVYLLHTVGAKRCKSRLPTCADGCLDSGSFNGVPLYDNPLLRPRWILDEELSCKQIADSICWQMKSGTKGTGRVLCLDGGGIKGLVMTQMLFVMQKVMGRPIQECFDWISGTSTGGFLALMLCTGKSVADVQSLYYNLKEKVFVGSRPYAVSSLEDVLRTAFGEDKAMGDIKSPRVTITATVSDRLPADLYLFRNYESPSSVMGFAENSSFMPTQPQIPSDQQRIWLAARSSGAAPTYFSACDKFLDGGLVANNPVLDTLTEIEEWNMAVRARNREDEIFTPTVVVSLGCGKPPIVQVDNIDLAWPSSLLDMRRGFQACSNMFNLLVEQTCAADGRVVDRARSWCSVAHVPFFRLTPQLSQEILLDEHDDEKLVRMMWETRAYMNAQMDVLGQLKTCLLRGPD